MLKHWSGLGDSVCPSGERLCSWVSDCFPLSKPILPSALLASLLFGFVAFVGRWLGHMKSMISLSRHVVKSWDWYMGKLWLFAKGRERHVTAQFAGLWLLKPWE